MRRLRQDDFFTVKVRFLRVNQTVEWCVFFAGYALAGVKHCIKGFTRMVGEARALVQGLGLQPVVEEKIKGRAQVHGQQRKGKSWSRELKRVGLQVVRRLDPSIEYLCATNVGYSTSKIPAAPMPPPIHIVTQTRLAPRRLPSISAWPVRRWPVTP